MMMTSGAVVLKRSEGISVFQAPNNNTLHRIYAVALGVVLQHHRIILLDYAGSHILKHLVGSIDTAGIVAVHIPVKILKAPVFQFLGQKGHNPLTVFFADPVGAAAGETEHGDCFSGEIFQNLLHPNNT